MKIQNKILLFLFLIPTLSNSQGFHMNDQGVRASGMGGFTTAIAGDASVAYYNPAAISRVEKSQLTAGVGIIFPRISYLDPYSGNIDMDPTISLPFHAYGVAQLKGKISAGVAVYTPFSENISWEDNWTGRYLIIKNRFRTLNIQPVISWKIGEHFSLGAGPVISWAGLKRTVAIDISSSGYANAVAEHKSASTGFGYTAAVFAEFNTVSIGVTYHSAINQKMKNGETVFNNITESAALLEGIPSSGTFSVEVTMPSSIDGGIAYAVNDKLQITVNSNYTFWSPSKVFEVVYTDELKLTDARPSNYEDAVSFSGGGNFKYTEKTSFRAGIGWTRSHVPDGFLNPAHPDADHLIYSGGLSYLWKKGITLDFSLMVKDYKSRQEALNMLGNFNGDYKSTLYIGGIGINYEF